MVGDKFEKEIVELVYKKYVLKFRNNYINKIIRSKCEDLYKQRRELEKELKYLKEKLLTETTTEKDIIEIRKRISEITYELKEIEDKIMERANLELEIKGKIKDELRKTEKELKKKISAIINEDKDVKKPVEDSIYRKDPSLSVVVIVYDEAMNNVEPKPILVSSVKVPGDGTGVRG